MHRINRSSQGAVRTGCKPVIRGGVLGLLVLLTLQWNALAVDAPVAPFGIHVVDDKTGRGVPMVELKTVSGVQFWTDSGGWAAVDDPALVGRKIFFDVSSMGYEFPADGFGSRGRALDIQPGATAVVKIKRLNIAERLYRITGEGIYAESVKLGQALPIHQPLVNAEVAGQDSAHAVVYRGKIHWFWGDTMRQSYPLGHYGTAGALSELPGSGGLQPAVGIDLTYFVGDHGFSRPMLKVEGNNPKWLDGVMVVKDEKGFERIVGMAARVKDVGTIVSRDLVTYDDASDRLIPQTKLAEDDVLVPCGHPFPFTVDGVEYRYFGDVYPNLRVRAAFKSATDPKAYEGYTCLAPGKRFSRDNPPLELDPAGAPVWGWKRDTPPLTPEQEKALIRSGRLKVDQLPFDLHDAESGAEMAAHRGSVCWNEFRKKWVMIATQYGGKTSFLGEVWYAEAEKIEGPWKRARKIVTHDKYSFYNPLQHPFFDEQGGKFIYFEGTYTGTFSRKGETTPRYEYNQMMYRLDLSDERLH